MYLKKVYEIPQRESGGRAAKWIAIVSDFLSSDMDYAQADIEVIGEPARRTYNGLLMAVKRKFSDCDVCVHFRNGSVYLSRKKK